MKIIILNGSPKGKLSITLQYVNFIKKKFPDPTYRIHHIGERINRIARNDDLFVHDVPPMVLVRLPLMVLQHPLALKEFNGVTCFVQVYSRFNKRLVVSACRV